MGTDCSRGYATVTFSKFSYNYLTDKELEEFINNNGVVEWITKGKDSSTIVEVEIS